ncbi:MAG: YciI family protein [Verrucomicrobiota bacterium]
MKYAIIVNETEEELANRYKPEKFEAYMAPYMAYAQALTEAGLLVGGEALEHPKTAITIRNRDGKRIVQDGPFAETKEMLGGFFLIEVPDQETALEWAAKAPSASTGSVELRALMPEVE